MSTTLRWADFEAQLTLRIASSARIAEEIVREQMRGIVRRVIEVTPPGHGGAKAGTRAATEAGRAKVASDIGKLYGTPSDAFDAIEKKNPADARAFWAVRTRRPDAAADIVRKHTGAWYGPFDGGALHKQRFQRGRVKGRKDRPILYISDPAALAAYRKEKQDHVNWLAAGWREISRQLAIALPAAIARHGGAPSIAVIRATEERIVIRGINAVNYAAEVKGLQRRIQFAIDAQTGAMRRQWQHFLNNHFSRIA